MSHGVDVLCVTTRPNGEPRSLNIREQRSYTMENRDGNDSMGNKSEIDNILKRHDQDASAIDERRDSSKKRRKVNQACVYCRRSHMTCDLQRPCQRCIKRNIGHLCHDEPRDGSGNSKKAKSVMSTSVADESDPQTDVRRTSMGQQAGSMGTPLPFDNNRGMDPPLGPGQAPEAPFDPSALGRGNQLELVQPTPGSGIQANAGASANAMPSNIGQLAGFSDTWMPPQYLLHDMASFNSNHMTAEVSGESDLFHDFLHTSLLDGGALLPETIGSQPDTTPGFISNFNSNGDDQLMPPSAMHSGSMLPPPLTSSGAASSDADKARGITRPSSVVPLDTMKLRKYYLEVADPAGNDPPAERMNKLLRAKVEAGELKPFNYVKGYTRLFNYLQGHVTPVSREKIRRQLERFRPKFRDMVQALNDVDLVKVEMWLEETLLRYDRVFASMAVPACCWRRTGEIVRGNKEMAELIGVPVEQLRDGTIALHEILTEDSAVRYWEEFGTIAFDPAHETLITATTLKSPDDTSNRPTLRCCFSFKIVRETHNIPTLIVGNFLPHDPE